MACACFEEGRVTRCLAVAGTLIPSHHERERYCRGGASRECPTFKLFEIRREPVSQEAYYALWLPPAAPVPIAPSPLRVATSRM
jgi:hypothetical protein